MPSSVDALENVVIDHGREGIIVGSTERLCPLVAVRPMYMHPYSVAKVATSLEPMRAHRPHSNIAFSATVREGA